MKKTTTLLTLCALMLSLSTTLSAQTKKKAVKKSTAAVSKTTTKSAVETENKTSTVSAATPATVKADTKEEPLTEAVKTKSKAEEVASYKTALGVKFLWGIAFTGKHFFKNQQAIEAIVKYRGYGGVGSDINLALLYEYHQNIKGVDGLRWYAGGGVYAGYFSFKNEYDEFLEETARITGEDNYKKGYFGIVGALGLEYKFEDTPIALSVDWQPAISLQKSYGSNGFSGENGGLGIKYTF